MLARANIENSDMDLEDTDIGEEITNQSIDLILNIGSAEEFPTIVSDYHNVLEEIEKEIGRRRAPLVSNSFFYFKTERFEGEGRREEGSG